VQERRSRRRLALEFAVDLVEQTNIELPLHRRRSSGTRTASRQSSARTPLVHGAVLRAIAFERRLEAADGGGLRRLGGGPRRDRDADLARLTIVANSTVPPFSVGSGISSSDASFSRR